MAGVTAGASELKAGARARRREAAGPLAIALERLASLQLTVLLFALSIVLVLVGTLAQDKIGIWDVMNDYFRSFVVWVPFNVLFPQKWFPDLQGVPGGFWFFGGRTLGLALSANLIAAHLVRFKVAAKGARLWGGWLVFVAGLVVCGVIIAYGSLKDGVQDRPLFDLEVVRGAIVISTVALCLGCAVYAWRATASQNLVRAMAIAASLALAGLALGIVIADLQYSAVRILWQLVQGTIGGLVLLAGSVMVFRKRGGMVVLHLGIGLLMFNELFVSVTNVEEQITLIEGEETSIARDSREAELVISDRSDAAKDKWITVSGSSLEPGNVVKLPEAPFDVRVEVYYRNSTLESLGAVPPESRGGVPECTQGLGVTAVALPLPVVAGAEAGNQTDVASAYVTLLPKEGGDPLATLLLPQEDFFAAAVHPVEVGGKTYYLALRQKQTPKPYSLQLLDVEKEDYIGTTVPRHYESVFRIHRHSDGTDLQGRISMNEPLRYGGETFYQSGYFQHSDGREQSTIQIVTNSGWMMPYVSCMLVAIGMLAHMAGTLGTRISKLNRPSSGAAEGEEEVATGISQPTVGREARRKGARLGPVSTEVVKTPWWPTAVTVAIALAFVVWGLKPKAEGEYHLSEAGKLPVTGGGRVMPLDSLARNTLRQLQKKEEARDNQGNVVPPTRWLLDVISGSELADEYKVFKVQNLELLSAMELPRRSGFLYSYAELEPKRSVVTMQAEAASKKQQGRIEKLEKIDEAALDLVAKMRTYETLVQIHRLPESTDAVDPRDLLGLVLVAAETTRPGNPLPLVIPSPTSDRQWETLTYHIVRQALVERAKKPAVAASGAEADPASPEAPTVEDFATRLVDEWLTLEAFDAYVEEDSRRLKAENPSWTPEQLTAEVRRRIAAREIDATVLRNLRQRLERSATQARGALKAALDLLFTSGKVEADANPAAVQFAELLRAYRGGDVKGFNERVAEYRAEVPAWIAALDRGDAARPGSSISLTKVVGEYTYHAISPFYLATIIYLLGALVTPLGWMLPRGGWRQAAAAMLWVGFAVHLIGMVVRIWISGRPPVTSLYSSALFIGLASVLFFLLIERITKVGVGNLLASVLGFVMLLIAYFLSLDSDTFSVMQAVLDTQFWLATHVVCITLGYVTTFVAGFLGVVYVLAAMLVGSFRGSIRKTFGGLIYGLVCFSLLLSFVGTVLGGLWADDSWGRFWGWDPKENGALIIVIWNALILHARWGAMIRDRGVAVLAIFGNVVTAWSWFGTNQLGFGLHSYGFTQGVLLALGGFALSQLLLVVLGMLPMSCWKSAEDDAATS